MRTKHAADAFLMELDLDWTVLRPSVVYTTAGSYGGTSLLRALSVLPFLLPVPGDGQQRLQPLHGEDLARAVVRLLETGAGRRRILEAVGPQQMTLEEYLHAWRRWLGYPKSRVVHVPLGLARPLVWLGEKLSHGPLGMTMYRMLQRGNISATQAAERFATEIGFRPRSVEHALQTSQSYVQDRWQARLYFVRPPLRVGLGLLWFFSGLVGFLTPWSAGGEVLSQMGAGETLAAALVYTACTLDILIGLAVLARRAVKRSWGWLCSCY